MARDAVFDRSLALALQGTREQVQKAFVAEARRQHDRVLKESRPSGQRQFVDQVEGAPLESVDAFGTILIEYSYLREIAAFVLEVLQTVSPFDSGAYVERHTVYIDGEPAWLDDIGTATRVVITNDIEYARRIVTPRKDGSGWSKQSQVPKPPSNVYRYAVAAASRRYGNIAKIAYEWVQVVGGDARDRVPAVVIEVR